MPGRSTKRGRSYKAPGRKAKRGRRGTTPLKRAFRRVQRAKTRKRMIRTVKKAKSRAISALPLLRQPSSCLVKFNNAFTHTFRLQNVLWDDINTSLGAGGDTSAFFPADGLQIRQNDIYNPMGQAGVVQVHANGFTSIGEQYGKYRVVGSKTVIRVRRMGSWLPLQHGEGEIEPITEGHEGGDFGPAAFNNTITTGPSSVANFGDLFDPSTADPMLAILIDRNAWQEANSQIENAAIDEYKDLRQFAHLKGIQWREIKAGPAQKATIVHKFTEKSLRKVGGDTDYRSYNTGQFPLADNGTNQSHAGTSPPQVDDMILKLKPFDTMSAHKRAYNNARFLVTIDQEFICKCWEPKYAHSRTN